MAEQHTPGPWNYNSENRTVWAGDIAICEFFDTAEGLEGDCPAAEANARLVAATLGLLEACKRAREALTFIESLQLSEAEQAWIVKEIASLDDAVAKAKGG